MSIGPCVKQVVTATIVTRDGKRYAGANYCENAQPTCPRVGMPTGVGYELCRDVCRQVGHAEVVALRAAERQGGAVHGATCYIEGHTYACDNCLAALRLHGITKVVFSEPPLVFGHSGMDSTLDFLK